MVRGTQHRTRHGIRAVRAVRTAPPGNSQQHQHQHQQRQQRQRATAPDQSTRAWPRPRRYNLRLMPCGTRQAGKRMTVRTCLHRCTEISIFLRGGHRSAAVLQVFPGPCTAPQHHTSQPTQHAHAPVAHHSPHAPNRARTTFGFECHASCPSLSPCPPASTLSRPPTPTLAPCPAHEALPLPTLPSAAAAAAARAPAPAPVPAPMGPSFPSLCLPFWVSRPVPSCPLDPCPLSQECLSPVFPPTACT